jgi:hypothetical protein
MSEGPLHITPDGFNVSLDLPTKDGDVAVPVLTLHCPDNEQRVLRFGYPDCSARKLGLCLVAYDLAAKAPIDEQEFLLAVMSDLRDLVLEVQDYLKSVE